MKKNVSDGIVILLCTFVFVLMANLIFDNTNARQSENIYQLENRCTKIEALLLSVTDSLRNRLYELSDSTQMLFNENYFVHQRIDDIKKRLDNKVPTFVYQYGKRYMLADSAMKLIYRHSK